MSTQVTVVWSVCRLSWMVESTGMTSDWSKANAETATVITTKVIR